MRYVRKIGWWQFSCRKLVKMSSLSINSLMKNLQNLGTTPSKPPIIERTHFTGGGGGGSYHHYGGGGGGGGSYHHYGGGGGGGKKHSIALTALTLLSFLFFLNILQNCLQDQMDQMNVQQQVIIMQARLKHLRDAGAEKRKGEVQIMHDNSSMISKKIREDRQQDKIKIDNNPTSISVKLRTVKGRD